MNKTNSKGLGELASTAICGNDITSSCLYVSALAIGYAGRWAPICLLLVGGTLYLFRWIYAEVVGAMPLNGGAYNALLNTTSKFRASIAACLTILSYMATAVISSNEAMHYLESMWSGLPIMGATIALLGLFMILTIIGITESSFVAIGIFLFHLTSMAFLLVLGAVAIFSIGTETLWSNLTTPEENGFWASLFFGFSAAMLGISGFESSANFVEEQRDGVFPKTLRNMWLAVTVLNPGMAMLALALVSTGDVKEHYEATLLSQLGMVAGGKWLSSLISVDAVLVLSGATLTSFVGVAGLVRRMTLDRCLPQILIHENRAKSPYVILIVFFVLCVSVLIMTGGDIKSLAAVYTLSFLSVMAMFAIGNLLLKFKRAELPRPTHASYLTVFVALLAVSLAILGNARLNSQYLIVFLEYLIPTILIVAIMLTRVQLLELAVFFVDEIRRKAGREKREAIRQHHPDSAQWWNRLGFRIYQFDQHLHSWLETLRQQQVVFFTRGDNVRNLNLVMLYIRDNEHTNRVKFVTFYNEQNHVPPKLAEHLRFLDEVYPEIDIEFVAREGKFSPEQIINLSEEWNVPPNLMFIGAPTGQLHFRLADLHGVRMIV
ncbi:MAG: APC family permease [Pirellulaceae bacterium]